MSAKDYSIVAADNNALPPIGAPEGMAANLVNNTMREGMSVFKRFGGYTADLLSDMTGELKARLETGVVINVTAGTVAGDGLGGYFKWDAASLTAVSDDVIISDEGGTGRWLRVVPLSVKGSGISGAAPAFVFSSAAQVAGFYTNASDTLSYVYNGVQHFLITSAGEATFTSSLDVDGQLNLNASIRQPSSLFLNEFQSSTSFGATSGTSNRVTINSDGVFSGFSNVQCLKASGTVLFIGGTETHEWIRTAGVNIVQKIVNSGGVGVSRNTHEFFRAATLVGSISNTDTATSFNTTSDPRLKTKFKEINGQLAIDIIKERFDKKIIGEFKFKADTNKVVWGYDAHKVLDASHNFGATEGIGDRNLNIGDVISEEIFKESGSIDKDGNPIMETDKPEQRVTPASVDQSKSVPLLEAAIHELIIRIEKLEK